MKTGNLNRLLQMEGEMPTRKRVNFYLEEWQYEGLKKLSSLTRVKVSDYIREGTEMVLQKYKGEVNKAQKKGGK